MSHNLELKIDLEGASPHTTDEDLRKEKRVNLVQLKKGEKDDSSDP